LSPRGIDLLTPGDPTDIPEELWEEWRRDEYEADYAVDGHRLDEQEEVLAGLEENPELVARIAKRLDEITRRAARRSVVPIH